MKLLRNLTKETSILPAIHETKVLKNLLDMKMYGVYIGVTCSFL